MNDYRLPYLLTLEKISRQSRYYRGIARRLMREFKETEDPPPTLEKEIDLTLSFADTLDFIFDKGSNSCTEEDFEFIRTTTEIKIAASRERKANEGAGEKVS